MHAQALSPARRLRDPLGVAGFARRNVERVLAALALWHDRARKRRQLARWASGHGHGFIDGTSISSSDAFVEANKPFWKM